MIKIIIIDREEKDRKKTKTILSSQNDFEVVGLGKDGYDAVKLIHSVQPDIAILDTCFDDSDGTELIPLLKSLSPKLAVILFTSSSDKDHICKAIANEASAYLLKSDDAPILCEVVQAVYHGNYFMSTKVTTTAFPVFSLLLKNKIGSFVNRGSFNNSRTMPPGISSMELRIIMLIGKGLSTAEIARKLYITSGTARNYISTIMQKMGLRNRNQVALFAVRHRLIIME
jgi:DNA-binding NarL/FixJ family response regulator